MKLLESEPERILQWCAKVDAASPERARTMLNPLRALNYGSLDRPTIKAVEDALYYGILGVKPAQSAPRR